jgi:hypothetical protein
MDRSEMAKAIYDQDCQFVRYQDGLMWSRFQTVAAIEAAMLFGLYQVQSLGLWEKRALSFGGLILVALACLLTFTDRIDTQSHLARVRDFEKGASRPFTRRKPGFLTAPIFLTIVFVMLTVSNVFIAIKFFSQQSSSLQKPSASLNCP